jgi:hypothetical protein
MECPVLEPTMLDASTINCYPCNDAGLAQNFAVLKAILERLQAGKLTFRTVVEVLNYTGDTINVGVGPFEESCYNVYTAGNRRSTDEFGVSGVNIVLTVPVINTDVTVEVFEPVTL